MKKKYQSKILQAIHEDAKSFHELGIISDERMREYDEECLVKEPEVTYEYVKPARTEQIVRISAKGAN